MRQRTDQNLRQELHSLYLALFHARQACPDDFTTARLTTVMTAILSIKKHSWRVVGITREALNELAKVDFDKKKLPKRRLCRGHIVDRAKTTGDMFIGNEPLPINDFIDKVLQNDCTVIMLDKQNRPPFPHDFIPIDNPNADLFPNGHAGWDHRKQERDYLRGLYAREAAAGTGD